MADDNRYLLYARKSTEAEDRQVRSIDAQLAELRELAQRDGLVVLQEYIEKRSAKTPGRPIFNAMLERIETGDANGILAWHPDRLARNSLDGGRIIYLIDTQKIRRLQFHGTSVENTPQGKMILNAEFGFSKYYVDSLSENTKRGLREKVRRGEFPRVAPLGYLNDYRSKRIVIDPERAPIVRHAFERYATGIETIDSIRQFLAESGIRSRSAKPVSRNVVSRLFSNPVYYGHFRFGGEIYEGNHQPLVPKHLFDQVGAIAAKRSRYSANKTRGTPKPFAGLLRCAECGFAITAEIQKGYTYYRCTKKSRSLKCTQPYVRAEILDDEISRLLSPFAHSEELVSAMLRRFQDESARLAGQSAQLISVKRQLSEAINQQIQRLVDMRLDGEIDANSYTERKAALMSHRRTNDEEIAAINRGQFPWLEPFRLWLNEASTAGQTARHSNTTAKALLARKIFGSNLLLDRGKARGTAVNPWAFIADNGWSHDEVSVYEAARTHFSTSPLSQHVQRARIEH